ncbi:MAG: hypothetical protein GX968_08060 [Tissierellia bacterium]|nr:hypothetical protein [Tissierellia bacterium]
MSKIIKSFRIIEKDTLIKEEKQLDINYAELESDVGSAILTEARHQSVKILSDANEGAKKILEDAYFKFEEKLNEAQENAKEIFHNAKIEGHKEGYNVGYEDGKIQGHSEGYEIGYEEGKKASEKLIKEALEIKNEYIEIRNNSLKKAEEDVIKLVIQIYEKVFYQKVEEDEELIVSLVLNGIDNLEISEKLIIIVSEKDYETIKKSKDIILAKASLIDELDIRVSSDMKKGDCMIETSMGSVDVGVNTQLQEVEDLLKNILSNE